MIGEVVWYVTGRFYLGQGKSLADYGYFLHLAGIDASLFDGPIAETSAHFTFAARPFVAGTISNASLTIGLDPVGEFSVFLQRAPAATFADPASFGAGERIATFKRVGLVVGTTVAEGSGAHAQPLLSSNVFSARLVQSTPFEFGGREYDFRRMIGSGVTQFGTAAAQAVDLSIPGYSSAFPFTGSAIRLG